MADNSTLMTLILLIGADKRLKSALHQRAIFKSFGMNGTPMTLIFLMVAD
jgi:hypothetical protein